MEWIDTHTHLFAEAFSTDLDQTILRAKKENIQHCILPNIDENSIDMLMNVCRKYSMCSPMLGLHPCEVRSHYKEQLHQIENNLSSCKPVGIGEIGIDLYWDKQFKEEQIEAFKIQCTWANELHLPVSIHCRESLDLVLDIVERFSFSLHGVFHCFSGNQEQLKRVMALGMYLGIGGVISFKNNQALRDVIQGADRSRIVLETDAPYLAPHPNRGKRNEPSYIPLIGRCMAEIWGIGIDEVAKQSSQNAKDIFALH